MFLFLQLFTLSDAQALVKKDEKVVKLFFEFWKEKRGKIKGLPLVPAVRTEKKDGVAMHDPYVAFRRRVEKMQTRKVLVLSINIELTFNYQFCNLRFCKHGLFQYFQLIFFFNLESQK